MNIGASERTPAFFVTVGARVCAIPLHHVAETMRPLSIEPVAGTPDFVRGVSVIRGVPVPVVDLKVLLENGATSATYGRFVLLNVEERRVAIGVDGVIGLRALDPGQLGELPPMLRTATTDIIDAMGTHDAQLLVVLRAARIVPDDVWATLANAQATR